MARLVIRLLGGFEAVLEGVPVAGLESDKVRAFLAYLAVHTGQPQRREILTDLLWPDSPETAARASLRNALANLRRAIADHQASMPFLFVTRQAITFDESTDCWLDVAEFNRVMQNKIIPPDQDMVVLENAISLYRGPFLDGLSVASITFQEWLLIERERLSRQMVNALRRLAIKYAGAGQLDKAINYAWQQVELAPWEEEGQHLLIRSLAASGRRSEALAQYERCCRMLRETFDIQPCTETVQLYNKILAGELLPASTLDDPETVQLI